MCKDFLIEKYLIDRTIENRNKVVVQYMPLVYVVSKNKYVAGQDFEYGDLVSYGSIGLIKAVECFDKTKGCRFSTYALIRIRGEIMDGIRSCGKYPRSFYKTVTQINSLKNSLGFTLYDAINELSKTTEYNCRLKNYFRGMFVSKYSSSSLSTEGITFLDPLELVSDSKVDFVSSVEDDQLKLLIMDAMKKLSDEDRCLIYFRFFFNLSTSVIGFYLKLSNYSVRAKLTRAIRRIQELLGNDFKDYLVA